MTELEEFSELLGKRERGYYENWARLASEDDELGGYVTVYTKKGEEDYGYRTREVVTKSPTGRLYRWCYDECYTGYDDDERPYTDVVEVEKVSKMVEVIMYEEIK